MDEMNIHNVLVVGVATSSMSLILIHQLEDKLKAHDLYLCFLKNVNLWSRVCLYSPLARRGHHYHLESPDWNIIFVIRNLWRL